MESPFPWWYPVGGQLRKGGAAFRVWADGHQGVSVRVGDSEHKLAPESDGYFSGFVPGLREGDTYAYLVDGNGPFPDPASRFQPDGPHGPSQLVGAQAWSVAEVLRLNVKIAALKENRDSTADQRSH